MKIVFATYDVDSNGTKHYNFTAYRRYTYFGKFSDRGRWGFWYHKADGWLMAMDVRGSTAKEKVQKFEDTVLKAYNAKVIWLNANLMANKLVDGRIVIK